MTEGSCDGSQLMHWTMYVFPLDCLPLLISPSLSPLSHLSLTSLSPLSHPSLLLPPTLLAFDSVSAFCFRCSSISAFSISVSVFLVSSLSLSPLFYSILVLVVFGSSSVYHFAFPPRFGVARSL